MPNLCENMISTILLVGLFLGLLYFTYEDIKYMSIPLIPALLFCLIYVIFSIFVGNWWLILATIFALLLYKLKVYAFGDVLMVIPIVSFLQGYGIGCVLSSLFLLSFVGLLIGKNKLPYIPFLFISFIFTIIYMGGVK